VWGGGGRLRRRRGQDVRLPSGRDAPRLYVSSNAPAAPVRKARATSPARITAAKALHTAPTRGSERVLHEQGARQTLTPYHALAFVKEHALVKVRRQAFWKQKSQHASLFGQ